MSSDRNVTAIRNIVMTAVRFGVSANAAAAIANDTLLDYGTISDKDTTQIIDANKLQRVKNLLFSKLQEQDARKNQQDDIPCILFDGRKDWTLMYQEIPASSVNHPTIQKEEHYSVVSEPGGHYLFHCTPNEIMNLIPQHSKLLYPLWIG